jgi:lantibiotic modifying enzyme
LGDFTTVYFVLGIWQHKKHFVNQLYSWPGSLELFCAFAILERLVFQSIVAPTSSCEKFLQRFMQKVSEMLSYYEEH